MAFYLHWHSDVSDGKCSPEQIVEYVEDRKKFVPAFKECTGIAITDHDEINGVLRAKKAIEQLNSDLILVPAAEFSFSSTIGNRYLEGEMLGYGIYPQREGREGREGLAELIDFAAEARNERNLKLVELLSNDFSDKISMQALKEFVGTRQKYLSRHDIADFMVHKGIVEQKQDAFRVILTYGLRREKSPLESVVSAIHEAGGACVLPHGGILLLYNGITEDFYEREVLPQLLEMGLKAHELYPYHVRRRQVINEDKSRHYNDFFSGLNRKFGLLDGIWGEDSHFDWFDIDDVKAGSYPTEDEVVHRLLEK